jgi:hypothetical protein
MKSSAEMAVTNTSRKLAMSTITGSIHHLTNTVRRLSITTAIARHLCSTLIGIRDPAMADAHRLTSTLTGARNTRHLRNILTISTGNLLMTNARRIRSSSTSIRNACLLRSSSTSIRNACLLRSSSTSTRNLPTTNTRHLFLTNITGTHHIPSNMSTVCHSANHNHQFIQIGHVIVPKAAIWLRLKLQQPLLSARFSMVKRCLATLYSKRQM